MYALMLDTYNKMLFDATTGTILNDFVYRVGNLFLLGAFYLKWIDFSLFIWGYIFFLSLPAIYLTGLLIYRKQFNVSPKLHFISPTLRKEMISLSLFGIIGGVSSIALKQIDTIMLGAYTDLSVAGVYSIIFYFGTVVLIPSVALGKISSTIIADSWKKNDLKTIDDIYYKSSINQMFFSLLLFVLIAANTNNIIQLLGHRYQGTEWVIILVSLTSLIVASTGSSVQIIGTSHKYKVQTYSLGLLVVLSVIFYAIFIPILGMIGAALGSLLSISGASLLRVFYLKQNMNLFPYRKIHLICMSIGIFTFVAVSLIPAFSNFLIDLLFRCSLISVLFVGLSYLLRISDDFNRIVDKFLKQIGLLK